MTSRMWMNKHRSVAVGLAGVCALAVTLAPLPSGACSRLLWNTNGDLVVAGRSMDWGHSLEDMLYIVPRGAKMGGGIEDGPAMWTAKYGSVTSAISGWLMQQGDFGVDDGAADAINEKGFAAHLLYLEKTKYEERDAKRAGVSYMRWVRYLADNFASVEEAVAELREIQIVPVPIGKKKKIFGVHVAIEDKTGDSAIIEFIDGNLVIHHGREYTVMTNDPPYNVQIANLERYEAFGGEEPLPGNIEADERFVRLQYFSQHLPETRDQAKAAAYMLSAMRTVAAPFGAPYTGGEQGSVAGVYPTYWMSVTDLSNGVYYFNWVENPNIIWLELDRIDFSEGSGVRVLNPRDSGLVGDVSGSFEKVR